MISKKYFLLGMPSSGKSTVGKLLAAQLGVKFIDLDKVIVNKTGMNIPDIFEQKGEDHFRELERKYLNEIIGAEENFVLATGGGAPCFFDNMEVMNKAGVTIFLDLPIKDLYEKLSKKGTRKRPLLKDFSENALYEELMKKYMERKPYYEKARIKVEQKLESITNRVNQVIFAIKTLKE